MVGIVAVGAAAAATIISTDKIGAPGYCQTITNETSGIPFPSGYQSWKHWTMLLEVGPEPGTTLNDLCDPPAGGSHIAANGSPGTYLMPAETARAEFARAAFCAWADDWLKAKAAGDSATESQAADEIAGALQWPGSEVSPETSHVSSTKIVFHWFVPVQNAVQAGDTAPVTAQFDLQAVNSGGGRCHVATPPANSDGGTLIPPSVTGPTYPTSP